MWNSNVGFGMMSPHGAPNFENVRTTNFIKQAEIAEGATVTAAYTLLHKAEASQLQHKIQAAQHLVALLNDIFRPVSSRIHSTPYVIDEMKENADVAIRYCLGIEKLFRDGRDLLKQIVYDLTKFKEVTSKTSVVMSHTGHLEQNFHQSDFLCK